MRTALIVIGKTANKHLSALINDYSERINHYMPFEITYLPEVKKCGNMPEEQQKEKEADLILKNLNTTDNIILLDEHGINLTSIELSKWLNKKKQSGRKLVFIIGGPYGFSERVYKKTNEKISLSSLTFSHDMARLLLCEQIYRASTILKGESYHHG